MSIPVLPTIDVKFVAGTIGLFAAAPGAAYLAEFKAFNADPYAVMTQLASQVQKDAAKLADLVVANLGLTGAAATAGKDYLVGQFNANPTKHGQVIVDALISLTTLTADATFGAAATAVTAMINKGVAFSTVATNNTKDLLALKAAVAPGAVQSGTNGADTGNFTLGNDNVTVTPTTLTANDLWEDKSTSDADNLTLMLAGNARNPFANSRILNVETITINAENLRAVETLNPQSSGLNNAAGVGQNNTPVGTAAVGSRLNFSDAAILGGTNTLIVTGDSVNASVELEDVRDEVRTINAINFADDNAETEGVMINFFSNVNSNTLAQARTILGSQGADTITSTDGADSINGNRGNDAINGGGGNDTITGDAGNDTIWGSWGNDSITGGAGNDQLFTNGDTFVNDLRTGDADFVDGGSGNDYIQASSGDTNSSTATVLGSTGSDYIDLAGTTGSLSVDGQDDNDVVLIRNDAQTFTADFAKLEGGLGGNDALVLMSNVNDDVIVRAANASTNFEVIAIDNVYNVNAGVNAANVNGNVFTDATGTIVGLDTTLALGGLTKGVQVDMGDVSFMNVTTGSGNDTISVGTFGRVTGGAGNDTINLSVFIATDTVVLNNGGVDTVNTFQLGVDKIEISASAFSNVAGTVAGLTAASFITAAGNPIAVGANVPQFLFNSATGALFFDADGLGGSAAVQVANLIGVPGLAATDFRVVA